MGVQVIEARVQHLAATLREIDARPQEFGLAMLWRLSIDAGVTHSIGRSALYSLLELLDRHCGPVLRHMYIKRALAQLDKHQGVVSALLLLRRVFATFPVYAPKQATANAEAAKTNDDDDDDDDDDASKILTVSDVIEQI